jgi:hypothetical protein
MLDITWNLIGVEGTKHLAMLGVAWNSIGIEGIEHLAYALRQNTVKSLLY